jgi:hypothetical protein
MTKKELLIKEIEGGPAKINEKIEIVIASESSLKKDWLRPEEDEAWQNL